MDAQHMCTVCNVNFSRSDKLKGHQEIKHGDASYICLRCGKSFNRDDNRKRHQRTCQSLRFKCPRCHGLKENIQDLTAHMKLCPVPSCEECQQEDVELDQLKQHQKTHTKKRKAPASLTPAKRKKKGEFHCRVCMQSFATRPKLFLHKVSHMEDPRAYLPIQLHFDFEDERMNSLLRENADLIFRHHRFTQVSADYNFPLTMALNQDGWIREVHHALDLVSNLNNTESFKLNVSMGFILMHRETEEYRFSAPHNNNAFFKKPIRIDCPSSWREVYSQMDEESLTAYVTQYRENTKWIPLMMTNVDIHLFYLGVSMGAGELPQFIKTHNCIIGLDKDRHGSLYQDNLCGMRCLAFHLNHKETGDGYRGMEAKTKELKQQIGLVACTRVWRCFQHFCGYLFPLRGWICHSKLSERGIAPRQYDSKSLGQSSQLRDQHSCLPAEVSLWQLWTPFQPSEPLETAPGELCQCNRIWLSWQFPQEDYHNLWSFERFRCCCGYGATTVPMVYRVRFRSPSFSCQWKRLTHTQIEVVEKTQTHLSQHRIQCGWVWNCQMFCESWSKATDWSDDGIHGIHCWYHLHACRI